MRSFRWPCALVMVLACASISVSQDEYGEMDFERAESDRTAQVHPGQEGVYVVKKWDTLWDLAYSFMNDPFMWPEIWESNPQLDNPHLIYPGDRLRIPTLTGGRMSQPANRQAYLEQPDFSALTRGIALTQEESLQSDESETPVVGERELPDGEVARLFRSLVSKNFFTDDYLSKVGRLWFEKNPEGKFFPGNGKLDACEKGNLYRLYDEIKVELFTIDTYRPGDIIEVIQSVRMTRFNGKKANLIRTVGRAKVIEAKGTRLRAKLVDVYDVIRCSDRIGAFRLHPERTIDAVVEASEDLEGTVFERVQKTESPYIYDSFIIDKGSVDGVRFGDIFAVYPRKKSDAVERNPSIVACVVHLQETSSTLSIVKMHSDRLNSGDSVRLEYRLVFDQSE